MNNSPKYEEIAEEKAAKQAKIHKTARTVWMVLTPVFAVLVLWNLYDYANGKDNLRGILSPLGMIFLGFAMLLNERNKTLKSILLAIAMVIIISGLIMVFVY